jgi:hypothetical protein
MSLVFFTATTDLAPTGVPAAAGTGASGVPLAPVGKIETNGVSRKWGRPIQRLVVLAGPVMGAAIALGLI